MKKIGTLSLLCLLLNSCITLNGDGIKTLFGISLGMWVVIIVVFIIIYIIAWIIEQLSK